MSPSSFAVLLVSIAGSPTVVRGGTTIKYERWDNLGCDAGGETAARTVSYQIPFSLNIDNNNTMAELSCDGQTIRAVDYLGNTLTIDFRACHDILWYSRRYTCMIEPSTPCFARESARGCRLLSPSAAPSAAYNDCFGSGSSVGAGEKVPMSELAAGDLVLSSPFEATRVIVNQHKAVSIYTQMLRIEHSEGTLELTPDHVLLVDGVLAPARDVKPGSRLKGGNVESIVDRVSRTADAIINPVTTNGYILAAGPKGAPVVASAYPEWVAGIMLTPGGVLLSKYSLSSGLSYLAPEAVQAFYDAKIEAFFAKSHAALDATVKAVPSPIAYAVILGFDLSLVAAFLADKLGSAILAIAAISMVASEARKAGKTWKVDSELV